MSSTGAENKGPARRKPLLAWIAPLTAAALAVGGGVFANNTASAEPPLPKKTAQQLLTGVAGANVPGLSGTVTETANLGLPSLPTGGQGGPTSSSDFSGLLSGTHTLKVWTSGTDKSRVAMLGTYGESDLIRNGKQAWLWSSKEKKAVHSRFVGVTPDWQRPGEPAGPASTPQEMARQVLKAIDPSTTTTVARNVTVAGRSAYQLVLTPKDSRSLVDTVTIAVDARTSVPLQVQVTADGQTKPAISVGFTTVDFSVPDAKTFVFDPPQGTKVTEHTVTAPDKRDRTDARKQADKLASRTKTVGTGWTTVVITKADKKTGADRSMPGRAGNDPMVQALPRVSGSWGSGRLLSGALFSAVITDDGRVAVGAVRPQLLYSALQK
jgi:outer membrane lipoprotein-sorting protein